MSLNSWLPTSQLYGSHCLIVAWINFFIKNWTQITSIISHCNKFELTVLNSSVYKLYLTKYWELALIFKDLLTPSALLQNKVDVR